MGFLKGSFNFSLGFRFADDGPAAIIRFPKPRHTATSLHGEKVTNEVRIMEFLTQNTTIAFTSTLRLRPFSDLPRSFFVISNVKDGPGYKGEKSQLTLSRQSSTKRCRNHCVS